MGKAARGCANGRSHPRQVPAPCDASGDPGEELPDQGLAVAIPARGEQRQVEGTVDRRGRELGLAAVPGSFIRLPNPLIQQP